MTTIIAIATIVMAVALVVCAVVEVIRLRASKKADQRFVAFTTTVTKALTDVTTTYVKMMEQMEEESL